MGAWTTYLSSRNIFWNEANHLCLFVCLYISRWWLAIDVMLSAMESTSACNISGVRFLDIAGHTICDLDTVWNRCWTDINSHSAVTWLTLEARLAWPTSEPGRRLTSASWPSAGRLVEPSYKSLLSTCSRTDVCREAERTVVGRENWCNNFLFYITSFF